MCGHVSWPQVGEVMEPDYPASKWVIIGMVHAQTGASHLAEARRYGTDRVSAKDIMAQLGSVDP
jgi:hypothetical protein